MSPPTPMDPNAVGQRINDALANVHNAGVGILESQAIEWVKAAQAQLMHDLDKAYLQLQQTRTTPHLQPAWAVDPEACLILKTVELPAVLALYHDPIRDNLLTLLNGCGFHRVEAPDILLFRLRDRRFHFSIYFLAPRGPVAPAAFRRLLEDPREEGDSDSDSGRED
ncbi:hypothetical protein DFH06DRAFT_1401620 [Mycena polygramma]|nr:hypothetical protein DFH06DRAFT_1401620 [Mycena polygramma]